MKIYSRLGTKIMYGSLIVAVLVAGLIHNYLPEAPASMWEFLYVNLEIYVSIIVLYAVIIAAGNIPETNFLKARLSFYSYVQLADTKYCYQNISLLFYFHLVC